MSDASRQPLVALLERALPTLLERALLALLGLAVAAGASALPVTGRGTEFWGCWPRSHLSLETSAEIVVMADAQTQFEVDGSFTVAPQTVTPGVPVVIPLPDRLRNAADGQILPLGFRVRALDPMRPISVLLRVPRQAEASDDIARLLSVDELGLDYIVTSWEASLPGEPSFYDVIATEDDTNVSAFVPCTGATSAVTLDAGEVYQVLCDWLDLVPDVTAATVTADKPVAVLAGNSDAYVPTDYLAGDFVVESMVPVASWGTEFVCVPFELGPRALPFAYDVVRIIASDFLNMYWDDGATQLRVPFPARGAMLDLPITGPMRLTADKPISVHQFMTGIEMSDMGDPSMVQLQPVETWSTGYRFYVPPDYTLGSFVTISVPVLSTFTVMVDGVRPTSPWFPAPGGVQAYTTVPLGMVAGEHVVTADVPVSCIVHGYNDAYRLDPGLGRVPGSYAYPAAHAAPPCLITARAVGPASSCVGREIHLTDDGASVANCTSLLYRWLKDGVPLAGCDTYQASPECTTTFDGQATYTLEVACEDNPACSETLPLLVVDQPAPDQILLPNPAEVCPGAPLTLEAEIGFSAYIWSSVPPDPGVTPFIGSLNTIVVTPDVDTVYSLVAADSRGCTSSATSVVTVLPDPLPGPIDASLRVVRDGLNGVNLSWADLTGADVGGYESVFLECPTREYRRSCGGNLPDPVTMQASPRIGPLVAAGVQEQVQSDALLRGDLIFYYTRAVSPCNHRPGPTCNGWPHQLPPCP